MCTKESQDYFSLYEGIKHFTFCVAVNDSVNAGVNEHRPPDARPDAPLSTDATERARALPLLQAKHILVQEHVAASASTLPSDEELLGRIQNQDEESLLALFRRYSKLAFSIGCRILRDVGEAEDLVQEVFLRLHAYENSFDNTKGSARTWMVQMIYRRALDRRAYLSRRHFYNGTDAQEHMNAIDKGGDLENDMIERLTAQQLRAAFCELNDKQRETLELFFFEGLKLAEIAERSNDDVKNIRHHYYRGLERLRQIAREMIRTGKVD
jgi:RNA polymerase sigma-70 factor (ECF subfamily)